MNVFSQTSPWIRALAVAFDFFILQVLWCVCSLLVVTVGAATTALHYAAMRRLEFDDTRMVSNFFSSFRANFKQATLTFLIQAALTVVLAVDLYVALTTSGWLATILLIVCALVALPVVLTGLYIYPVISRFENTIPAQLRNAFFMSLHNFPTSLILLAVPAGTVLLIYWFPYLGFILLFAPALYAYYTSMFMIRVFRRYISDRTE